MCSDARAGSTPVSGILEARKGFFCFAEYLQMFIIRNHKISDFDARIILVQFFSLIFVKYFLICEKFIDFCIIMRYYTVQIKHYAEIP